MESQKLNSYNQLKSRQAPIDTKKRLAKLTSDILNPFLVSSVVIVLLSFASTAMTSEAFKFSAIAVALSVLPVLAAVVYLVRHQKLDGIFVSHQRQRTRIYLLASIWAVIGGAVLRLLGAPLLLVITFVTGLVAIVIFMSINLIWKISLHTAFVAASVTILFLVFGAKGALTAVLIPPVAWARIELEHHSIAQVVTGALLAALIVWLVFHLFGLTGTLRY